MRKMKPAVKLILIIAFCLGLYFVVNTFKDNILPESKKPGNILDIAKNNNEKIKIANSDKNSNTTDTNSEKVLRVIINTWPGFASSIYFNNGFNASEESRFYTNYGFKVQFIINDDPIQSRNIWLANEADLMWTTVDCFPTQYESVKHKKPKIFFQIDWSRGDSIIVSSEIKSVDDFRGKEIAYADQSPSMTLLIETLLSGNLDFSSIVPIPTDTTINAEKMFKTGKVPIATVWSPGDSIAVRERKGSKILFSTKTNAQFIIADAFYASADYIKNNKEILTGFVEGTLIGVKEIYSDSKTKELAAKLIVSGFEGISIEESLEFIENAKMTNFGENRGFFGLDNSYKGVKGEDIFGKMAEVYQVLNLAPKDIPSWREITNTEILKSVNLKGEEFEEKETVKFEKLEKEKEENLGKISSKSLSITFLSNSSELDDNSKQVIDLGFVGTAKRFAGARIRIVGHTDSVGNRDKNIILSKKRAQVVCEYLINEYSFDRNRFVILGNGPDYPIETNETEVGRSKNRRTEFQLLSE